MAARRSKGTSKSALKTSRSGAKSKKRAPDVAEADLPAPSLARRVGWIALFALTAFLLVSLISFDAADPPSHAAAPLNDPVMNWCGPVGAFVAYHTYLMIGTGAWVALAALIALLAITATGRIITQPIIRAVGFLLMTLSLSAMHGLLLPRIGPLPSVPGGLVGTWGVAELSSRFSGMGTFLCLLAIFLMGAIVAVDRLVLALPMMLVNGLRAITGVRIAVPRILKPRLHIPGFGSVESDAFDEDQDAGHARSRSKRGRRKSSGDTIIDPDAGGLGGTDAFDPEEHEIEEDEDGEWEYEDADDECEDDEEYEYVDEDEDEDEDDEWEYVDEEEEDEESEETTRKPLSKEELKQKIAKLPLRMASSAPTIARDEDIPREVNYEGYEFPALALLENPEGNYSEKMEKIVRAQAEVLEETLQTYHINGEVVGIDSGPVVTLYKVELAPGTKVSKVTTVSKDVARALRAQNIRIVPNIAGGDLHRHRGAESPQGKGAPQGTDVGRPRRRHGAAHVPRQGRIGRAAGRRPHADAAHAHRGHHRIGQIGVHEFDHHVLAVHQAAG